MKQISYHSVPDELYPYFWDTDVQALDLEKDKEYIISRLYNYGGTLGFIWVDRTYTDDDIKQIARTNRNWKPMIADYVRRKYGLKKEEMAYYQIPDSVRKLWDY